MGSVWGHSVREKTMPGAAFIGDVHTFSPDGAMATASTGRGFLRTRVEPGPYCNVHVWNRKTNKTVLCFPVRGIRMGLQGVGKDKHLAPFVWDVHTIFARRAHAGGIHGWPICLHQGLN